MSKGWKAAERAIARDCGGKRIPVTGERDGADVEHPVFCVQLKVRKALPIWLFTWLAGICSTATRQGKTGILILNRPRTPRRHAIVCLRWEDFVDLVGDPKVPERHDEAQDGTSSQIGLPSKST